MSRFSIEHRHSPTQQRWFQMTVTPSSQVIKNGADHASITDRTQVEHSLFARK
jgi:hypothetical protein